MHKRTLGKLNEIFLRNDFLIQPPKYRQKNFKKVKYCIKVKSFFTTKETINEIDHQENDRNYFKPYI